MSLRREKNGKGFFPNLFVSLLRENRMRLGMAIK